HVNPFNAAEGQLTPDLDFQLREGALIEGTVTRKGTDQPAAVTVQAHHVGFVGNATAGAKTDDEGHYSLRVWPGAVTLRMSDPGDSTPSEVALQLAHGDHETGVDFTIGGPDVFTGIVLDADGKPLPGAHMWLLGRQSASKAPAPKLADADGRFGLAATSYLKEGPWIVFAKAPVGDLVGVVGADAGQTGMEVHLSPGGFIETLVVDEDGDPVPDAVLSVDVRSGQADRRNVPYDLVTDGRGVVHAGPLPAGGELCSLALLDLGDAFEVVDNVWGDIGEFELTPRETTELPALAVRIKD
ncbi:MAG TPA: hypothetical protein QGH10_22790, partial [Armatimonadota bacterium]|nr:hypothetical protein [Armatimonadota bacterium]